MTSGGDNNGEVGSIGGLELYTVDALELRQLLINTAHILLIAPPQMNHHV